MRRQKIEIAVFSVTTIVFILQTVGYLAPSWFVTELTLQHGLDGLPVDGKHLQVPFVRALLLEKLKEYQDKSTDPCKNSPSSSDEMHDSRNKRDTPGTWKQPLAGNQPQKNGQSTNSDPDASDDKPSLKDQENDEESSRINDNKNPGRAQDNADPRWRGPGQAGANRDGESLKTDENKNEVIDSVLPPSNGDEGEDVTNADENGDGVPLYDDSEVWDLLYDQDDGDDSMTETNPNFPPGDNCFDQDKIWNDNIDEQDESDDDEIMNKPDKTGDGEFPTWDQDHGNMHPRGPMDPFSAASKGDLKESNQKMPVADHKLSLLRTHTVYVSAGFWYGKACINSNSAPVAADNNIQTIGTEWCTIYARTNASALEKDDRNLVELRIEATIGVVLSLVSLIAASVSCFTQHNLIFRLSVALTSMFSGGAVMAIPVIHVILRHVVNHKRLLRTRNVNQMDSNDYSVHGLCQHWPAIVCGAGSIFAIASALVFTTLLCISFRKPRKGYDLEHPVTIETVSKEEFPVQCLCNGKAATLSTFVQDQSVLSSMTDIGEDIRDNTDGISMQTSAVSDGGEHEGYVTMDANALTPSARDGGDNGSYTIMDVAVKDITDNVDSDNNFDASINMDDFEYKGQEV